MKVNIDTDKESDVRLWAKKFLEEYQSVVDNLYKGLLKSNPEAFRLYNLQNVKIYYVELNDDFFRHNKRAIFIHKKEANLDIQTLDLTDKSYYEYDTPVFEKSERDILLRAINDISTKDIITSILVSDGTFELIKNGSNGNISYEVERTVRKEAFEYYTHINYEQDYYAKNAARYAYSELDLNPIIDKVNDGDFSYQLDQAISAYDNSLYLAACATLGVCLETVCKLLLVNNEKKVKDSDATMLDVLSEKLKANHLISYKLKKRIDVCYDVRNLAAHTSPGKVVKSDCHFILNTISEIVEAHF